MKTVTLRRLLSLVVAGVTLIGFSIAMRSRTQVVPLATATGFNDSHFRITNEIQEGIDIHEFLQIMGDRVGRSTLFGTPLQQQWSFANSGDFEPIQFRHSDAPLYYYSFNDAYIASLYLSLTPEEQARFDPMITGFNPADMYAVDHIRRVLTTYPGVFSGIGEFTIHREFVSPKIQGETPSLTNPALDRILDFAADVGLVVLIHNDIDTALSKKDSEQVYLAQMRTLLIRHPRTTIIWAHVGLGGVVHPAQASPEAADRIPAQFSIVEAMLEDPVLSHVNFDISPEEAGEFAIATPESIWRAANLINRYPDRFLFGTDTVAPARPEPYFAVFHTWDPVWRHMTNDASLKVRKANYERLFDAARQNVRHWENMNVRGMVLSHEPEK